MSPLARHQPNELAAKRRDNQVKEVWLTLSQLTGVHDIADYTEFVGMQFEFFGENGTITAGIIDNVEFHPKNVLRLSANVHIYEWSWDPSNDRWGRCQFTSRIWIGEFGEFKVLPDTTH